ncbi:MAG: YegS/Rv2252/BmrU family lipid kinase [Eubacteriaceae bacterium]|nr:YegS/Rv2252/BmrU family lipid kinase [Eubacteriaceae bacterium]
MDEGFRLRKKALLIVNPVSGQKAIIPKLADVIDIFQQEGYVCTALMTQKPGDATEFTMQYAQDYDLVVCTGGDGTLNETVTGLVRGGLIRNVGYIPCGSTNDFAATHSLSLDILTATRNIARGNVKTFDIGRVQDQFFTYVAAFGAFSSVSYSTDQAAKNLLGRGAYFLNGVRDLPNLKPVHMKITVNNRTYDDDFFFGAICNSTSVAGVFKLPDTMVNTRDGLLEVLLIRYPKTFGEFNAILDAMISQTYASDNIIFVKSSDIYIENPTMAEFALDGEKSEKYESMHISVLNRYLHLAGVME